MKRVGICIATFKRPKMLKDLLNSIQELEFDNMIKPIIKVFVIDNDINKSACTTVNSFKISGFPFPLIYRVEPIQGLSIIRNKLVNLAIVDSDYIVFIDDDEIVTPFWLQNLINTQIEFSADVVSGPSIPFIEDESWHNTIFEYMKKNKLIYPNGTSLGYASTSNILFTKNILLKTINSCNYVFNTHMNLAGGEDTLLTRQIKETYKGSIIFSNKAIVYESFPQSRLSLKWLLQRSYRCGITQANCDIIIYNNKAYFKTIILLKGIAKIFIGISLLTQLFFIKDRLQLIKLFIFTIYGFGMISGLTGRQFEEYKDKHHGK